MSRHRRIVLALIVAIQPGCSQSDRTLEHLIEAEADKGTGTVVQLSSLTDFSWDTVHVFPPYTSQAAIDEQLGFAWPEARATDIRDNDGIALLVFVSQGAVVRSVAQPRNKGDFAQVTSGRGLAPSAAVFVVRTGQDGHPWRVFQLAERP